MENLNANINYIFYLQTKNDLENYYFNLSDVLGRLNISLLPIRPEELKLLDKSSKNYLIILRNDLTSNIVFQNIRKTFLDVSMLNGRICVFDITSFSELDFTSKLEKKDTYKAISLPADYKFISMQIAIDYFNDRNKRDEWPGGKRAKLPAMNT